MLLDAFWYKVELKDILTPKKPTCEECEQRRRSEAYLSAAEHAAIDFYLTAMEHWRDRRPHSTITFNATPQGLPRYYCSPRGVIIAGNLLVDPDGNVTFGMIFRHEESDTVIRLDRNRNLHRYRRK